jgi:branched-chain amino acid transport system ATP-binding protein
MAPLLEVTSLSKHFGGLEAIADLSFAVAQGSIFGIIGPNGAGKSTTVNLVSGVIPPTGGRVRFAGADVTGKRPYVLARHGLVRTFQSTTVYSAQTVAENLMRGAYLYRYRGLVRSLIEGRSAIDRATKELLDLMGLAPFADAVAGSLPYGRQKMLGIAIGLAAKPRLLMLDEPVAGLSAGETDQIRDVIRSVRDRGITVVVIDHNMRFIANLCDHVLVLHHGRRLIDGPPDAVFSNPAVIEAYLGQGHAAA